MPDSTWGLQPFKVQGPGRQALTLLAVPYRFWLVHSVPTGQGPPVVWLDRGVTAFSRTQVAHHGNSCWSVIGGVMVIIGIDPHKASHTAAALDERHQLLDTL